MPKLRSNGAALNQTPLSVILGLAGLEVEAKEISDWFANLSPDEVVRACQYASFELNGFPTWFPKLFENYPKIVGDFLMQEVRYELSIETLEIETHYILSDVSWSGQWAWDELAPSIYKLLKAAEPKNLGNLDKLLKIVQGSTLPDATLASLAARKSKLKKLDHAARWFAVLAGVAPQKAIESLAERLADIADAADRTAFAMTFVTNLWGGRRREGSAVRQAFHTPAHLKSLYLLMHEHIRQNEDINRAGTGAYSPGLRDNAQDSRNSLFELLNDIPGKEAFLALTEIAKAQPDRPWFVRHARSKAEKDGDIGRWSAAEVREFHEKLERTPANHRELMELAVMRLQDLKDDLENGDSSVAGILKSVLLETDMRKYIGHVLREKSFGRYAIPQEEELADAKKPDLRFHGVGFDAPVPAELKLADKWSGPDLFERLENQLCGDYLRDNRSSRGLFVLVYLGQKTSWDVPGSANRVDFEGLVAALQYLWNELSASLPNVDDVKVIGVDLTKRTS